jgi:formamidopyrimidine-DNA glycosylase
MPELPEVETVRRGLQPVMEGRRFLGVETRRPMDVTVLPFSRSAKRAGNGNRKPARRAKRGGRACGFRFRPVSRSG